MSALRWVRDCAVAQLQFIAAMVVAFVILASVVLCVIGLVQLVRLWA